MFRSNWRKLFTVFGLALVASSGQAQEHENEPQGSENEQQESAEPFAVPIEIIESQEAAEARERSEKESNQREKDDLLAQQGMDAATRRMAELAMWQTFLVAIGTAVLIYTLWLMRQANAAAIKAAEMAEKAISSERPYIGFTGSAPHAHIGTRDVFNRIIVTNCGRSPAIKAGAHIQSKVVPIVEGGNPPEFKYVTPKHRGAAIMPNAVYQMDPVLVPDEVFARTHALFVHVVFEYETLMNDSSFVSVTCVQVIPNYTKDQIFDGQIQDLFRLRPVGVGERVT